MLINNRELEIPAGKRLNVIEAARLVGAKVPHYCWHPSLSVVGSCRMCLVEIGSRDPKTGQISMQPKLVPGCNTIVTDNMVVVTDSEKVVRARAMVQEDLLLRHPIDCPICDKAGECKLQDYHFKHGQSERRADLRPFTSRRRDLGDVTLFVDRCILCSRCVRFTAEITGTHEIMLTARGTQQEIDVMPSFPLNNKLSGNVVDLCPVGALGDKDFLYRQRVWFLEQRANVCTGCSTGCSIWIEENQERIHRITPRKNPAVNKWFICNDGRYDYPHVHDPRRLTQPCQNLALPARERKAKSEPQQNLPSLGHRPAGLVGVEEAKGEGSSPQNTDGNPNQSDLKTNTWDFLLGSLSAQLCKASRLAAVLSPHLTVEEAYLLCRYIRNIDGEALLSLGPIPILGENERFPSGFTIAAEKCPNRRGVEAVISHFAQSIPSFDDLLQELDNGAIRGVWVSGGYKTPWIGQATVGRFNRIEVLVVQDLFPSPLSERATHVLPGVAFAERDGSYVNRADRLQSVARAIRPPLEARSEGRVLWELLGRKGLYDPRTILEEIAREIPYFSAVIGPVPETGIDLRRNLLAGEEKEPNIT